MRAIALPLPQQRHEHVAAEAQRRACPTDAGQDAEAHEGPDACHGLVVVLTGQG